MKKAAVFLLLATLGGCSWFGGTPAASSFVCPQLGLIDTADKIAIPATPGEDLSDQDIAVYGAFGSYRGACRPSKDKNAVEFNIDVDFLASKGPAGQSVKEETLPYFIAILSPDETILQRQAFTTTVKFDASGTAPIDTEKHHIVLPLENPAAAENYKVVVGFALTPAQFAFNHKQAQSAPQIPAMGTAPAATTTAPTVLVQPAVTKVVQQPEKTPAVTAAPIPAPASAPAPAKTAPAQTPPERMSEPLAP